MISKEEQLLMLLKYSKTHTDKESICFFEGITSVLEFINNDNLSCITSENIDNRKQTFTYIMLDTVNGFYKIGKSINITKREKTLQSEKPSIKAIFFVCGDIEKHLHSLFNNKRIRGEWFNLSKKDIETLIHDFDFIDIEKYKSNKNYNEISVKSALHDFLLKECAFLFLQQGYASTSLLQRKFKIGYNRAGRITDELEKLGIVGDFQGSTYRKVLIDTKDELEQIFNDIK